MSPQPHCCRLLKPTPWLLCWLGGFGGPFQTPGTVLAKNRITRENTVLVLYNTRVLPDLELIKNLVGYGFLPPGSMRRKLGKLNLRLRYDKTKSLCTAPCQEPVPILSFLLSPTRVMPDQPREAPTNQGQSKICQIPKGDLTKVIGTYIELMKSRVKGATGPNPIRIPTYSCFQGDNLPRNHTRAH